MSTSNIIAFLIAFLLSMVLSDLSPRGPRYWFRVDKDLKRWLATRS